MFAGSKLEPFALNLFFACGIVELQLTGFAWINVRTPLALKSRSLTREKDVKWRREASSNRIAVHQAKLDVLFECR